MKWQRAHEREKRGRKNMADMNDYMKAIIKALKIIHLDNVAMMSILTNSELNSAEVKEMAEIFKESVEGVLKQK